MDNEKQELYKTIRNLEQENQKLKDRIDELIEVNVLIQMESDNTIKEMIKALEIMQKEIYALMYGRCGLTEKK